MIITKLLSNGINLDENKIIEYIELSFSYYNKDILHRSKISKLISKYDPTILSNFIRFFRYINPTFNIDKDEIKEVFKNKQLAYNNLIEKVNFIQEHQNIKIKFEDNKEKYLIYKNLFSNNYYTKNKSNFKTLCNFNWSINIIMSNSECTRVLVPDILLIFSFTDGTNLKTKIDIKILHQIRKNFSFHIRKVLENESISLIK